MFRITSKILLLLICFLIFVPQAMGGHAADSELYGKMLEEKVTATLIPNTGEPNQVPAQIPSASNIATVQKTGNPIEDAEIVRRNSEEQRPKIEAEKKAKSLAEKKTVIIPLSIYDIEEIRLIPGGLQYIYAYSSTIPPSLLIKLKKPYADIDSLSWYQEHLEDLLAYLRLIQENNISEIVVQTHDASPKDDKRLEWELKPCNNSQFISNHTYCKIRAWTLRLDKKK